MENAISLLESWLRRQLDSKASDWLDSRLAKNEADKDLYLSFSLASRKVGKDILSLNTEDLAAAEATRTGWQPLDWRCDEAARILFMLNMSASAEEFSRRYRQLCITADMDESVALYKGLPLYPEPERYLDQAREGTRTNMVNVFTAIAHHNPWPSEHFPDDAWNQMVLKALFVEVPLYPIYGLDKRCNPDLMRMLGDYARERRAASRPVPPELWRCVGPVVDDNYFDDLARCLESDVEAERHAGMLALASSPHPKAAALLASHKDLQRAMDEANVSWQRLTT